MKRVGIVLLVGIMAACGGDGTEAEVTITGTVVTNTFGKGCRPDNDVSGKQITVRDGEGAVIATTETDEGDISDTAFEDVCEIRANYEVEVPEVEFYEFEFEGVDLQPDPVSFADLKADGFEYNLRVDTE